MDPELQNQEEAIGRGSFGLVFVARASREMVIVKKLLSEDVQEQRLFPKEAKILYGIKSENVQVYNIKFIIKNSKHQSMCSDA